MGMFFNPGNSGFLSAVRSQIYVDKSDLIQFTNSAIGTEQRFICVSRPRRFGKSITVKMLAAYYSRGCDSGEIFQALKIAGSPAYEKELNKSNVISLDVQWFRSVAGTRGDADRIVSYMQEEVIGELRQQYPDVVREEDISLPEVLLRIHSRTGEQFVVLLDEWDCLFREERQNRELQEAYLHFLRGMFKGGPAESYVKLAYMTGILPIKKYGTQSALNNFDEYTMARPAMLAKYVGFTEPEVKKLCRKYHMDFAEAKRLYDGYAFPKAASVYSPNSVIEAMRRESFGNYWTGTETYEALQFYIDLDEDGLKETLVQMLGGGNCVIDIGSFQNDMTSIKCRDDVLTLLVHLGYLAYDETRGSVPIPNEEVRQEFVRAVKGGKRRELSKLIRNSDQLLQDTLDGKADHVAKAIEKAHSAGTAPLFCNNEQALRSVIKFAYISAVEAFQEIQELPSGTGYADIVYLPKKGSAMPVIVIELKWNKKAGSAIQQTRDRNYPQALEGMDTDILLVAITYDERTKKHTCQIETHSRTETV